MEKGVLVLNTIASFLETGIGIWIFSKVFPKRERYGVPQQIAGGALYLLMAVIIYGNFAQSIPVSIYCTGVILPLILYMLFRKYSGEQKIHFLAKAVIIFLAAMMFSLLAWDSTNGYLAYYIALFGGVLPPLFTFMVYRCNYWQAYLWEFLYLTGMNVLRLMYFTYVSQTRGLVWYTHTRLYTYESVGFKFVIIGFLLLLVSFFPLEYLVKRLLCRYKKQTFCITGVVWVATLSMANVGAGGFDIKEMTIILVTVMCLLIGLLLAISMAFIKQEKSEKNLFEVRNAAIEQQYQEMRKAYEQNRRFVHDQKHMIQYLEECLSRGETQKAEEFLTQYKTGAAQSVGKTWTGISTLDFILNIKYAAMEQARIVFEWKAEIDEIPIDEADFVVLMGNLFDNAIEAASKCSLEDRKIFLSLRTVNQMLLIQMENSNREMPSKKKERFITTKQDADKHGWGIESIKYIVQKYEGDISFQYDLSKFCVYIVLNTNREVK